MSLGSFGLTTIAPASDLTITTADTVVCTPVIALTGMQSLTVSLDWRYGSGGTAMKAYIQTSLDGGNSWIDIACFAPTNASTKRVWNFSALTPVSGITPTDGAMTDNAMQDGILGDRVRVKVVSTGTYAGNTVLAGRMTAH